MLKTQKSVFILLAGTFLILALLSSPADSRKIKKVTCQNNQCPAGQSNSKILSLSFVEGFEGFLKYFKNLCAMPTTRSSWTVARILTNWAWISPTSTRIKRPTGRRVATRTPIAPSSASRKKKRAISNSGRVSRRQWKRTENCTR